MDKKTFDTIMELKSIENKLYFKLEKELDMERAEDLVRGLNDFIDQQLKIGKYLVEDKISNKEGYIIKKYEDIPSYTKMYVIYEYDNSYSLCETTSGILYLVPNELLRFDLK